ncbi:Urb2/Npa2 family-domain-containing protein [Protomyces lactucae-debilis]|uniref:Urb2/Npa2 family-domain-containing protein n=1 Tax=Protomyces lactucae-debilis TaxID=2754530 RepID=A0A1Y2FD07_PROLT|nr:Urb2/Npa2 family-domain-containing protein [Protomyces lactucae-debilis]ORY81497.1 Urb2/Npa2 family-domain-containing protein [Protomyces lactucae-debilis]
MTCEAIVKSLRNDQLPINERLASVKAARIPRKNDLLVNFLLREVRSVKADTARAVWGTLEQTVSSILPEKLAPLVRKSQLIAGLDQSLQVGQATDLPAIERAAQSVLAQLTLHRSLSKCLSCSIETSLSVIKTLMTIHAIDISSLRKEWIALLDTLVDFALFNAQYRHTSKKLTEEIIRSCLPLLSSAVASHNGRPSLTRLLQQTLWSEASLSDFATKPDSLGKALGSVSRPSIDFAQIAFEAIANASLATSKHVLLANLLLKELLPKVALVEQVVMLKFYYDNLPRPIQAKIIVSDKETFPVVKQVLQAALDKPSAETYELLTKLIEVDLDILIPVMDQIWTLLSTLSTSSIEIEHALFRMFKQIRALDEFLLPYAKLSPSAEVNMSLLEEISTDVSTMTEPVQRELLQSLLTADTGLDSRRLELVAAMVAGMPKGSPVLQEAYDSILKQKGHAASLLHFVLATKQSTPETIQPFSSMDEFETQRHLRNLELGWMYSDMDLRLVCGACLDSTSEPFLISLVDRWLPTITPLMTVSELSKLAQLILDANLHTHMNVLESNELLSAMQELLLASVDNTSKLHSLLSVPVDYFHKAVRNKIVQAIAMHASPTSDHLAILAKFARHDIFAKLDIDQFVSFADGVGNSILEAYVEHSQPEFLFDVMKSQSAKNNVHLMVAMLDRCASLNGTKVATPLMDIRCDLIRQALQSIDRTQEDLLQISSLDKHRVFTPGMAALATAFFFEKTGDSLQEALFAEIQRGVNPQSTLRLLAALATTQEAAITVALRPEAFPGTRTSEMLAETVPNDHLIFLDAVYPLLQPSSYLVLLQAFVERRSELSSNFLQQSCNQICKDLLDSTPDLAQRRLRLLHTIIDKHPRAIRLAELDTVFALLPKLLTMKVNDDTADIYMQLLALLRIIFERRAHLLRDRHHIILQSFAMLLSAHFKLAATDLSSTKATLERTEAFDRLFHTFLSSSRQVSSSPEQFNKALAKHLPWLLIEYIHLFSKVSLAAGIPADCRRILEESFAFEVMGLCGPHEREMVGAALDSSRRVHFKRLFEDWSKFGKWNET